jgi:hypothetical protein
MLVATGSVLRHRERAVCHRADPPHVGGVMTLMVSARAHAPPRRAAVAAEAGASSGDRSAGFGVMATAILRDDTLGTARGDAPTLRRSGPCS